jgi:hypothetical protein
VSGQPAIVFGLVSVQVVQDDVNFPTRMGGDGAVHEVQESAVPASITRRRWLVTSATKSSRRDVARNCD